MSARTSDPSLVVAERHLAVEVVVCPAVVRPSPSLLPSAALKIAKSVALTTPSSFRSPHT